MSRIMMGLFHGNDSMETMLNDPRYRVRKWAPVCNQDGVYYCVEYGEAEQD